MILVISATNRLNSNTRIIADCYMQWFNKNKQDCRIIDLVDLPPDFAFTALYERMGSNDAFNNFQKEFDRAEKLLFVVPEYNGSFPGVLKCFFDGLRYPDSFSGKKAAFTGLSSGSLGGAVALSHLTDIMHYYNVPVLPVMPRIGMVDSKIDVKKRQLTSSFELDLIKEQIQAFINF